MTGKPDLTPEAVDRLIEDIKRDREAGTSGEWYCQFDDDTYIMADFENDDGYTPHIADIVDTGNHMETTQEFVSNARRIARVPDMEAALIALSARVAELEAALKVYADPKSWVSNPRDQGVRTSQMDYDQGHRAREALIERTDQ